MTRSPELRAVACFAVIASMALVSPLHAQGHMQQQTMMQQHMAQMQHMMQTMDSITQRSQQMSRDMRSGCAKCRRAK